MVGGFCVCVQCGHENWQNRNVDTLVDTFVDTFVDNCNELQAIISNFEFCKIKKKYRKTNVLA